MGVSPTFFKKNNVVKGVWIHDYKDSCQQQHINEMDISHDSMFIRIIATSAKDNCTSYKCLLKELKAKSITQKKGKRNQRRRIN